MDGLENHCMDAAAGAAEGGNMKRDIVPILLVIMVALAAMIVGIAVGGMVLAITGG